jgi:hypothetical protein
MDNFTLSVITFYGQFSYAGLAIVTGLAFLLIAITIEKVSQMRPDAAVDSYIKLLREHDEFGGPADLSNSFELGAYSLIAGFMWPMAHLLFVIFALIFIAKSLGRTALKLG